MKDKAAVTPYDTRNFFNGSFNLSFPLSHLPRPTCLNAHILGLVRSTERMRLRPFYRADNRCCYCGRGGWHQVTVLSEHIYYVATLAL